MRCAKFGWNLPRGKEKIFKSHQCIVAIISPWKKLWSFIWTNVFPSPKNNLWQVWLNLTLVLEKMIFKCHKCNYTILLSSPHWNRACTFIRRNLNRSIHLKMLCAKFVEFGPVILEKTMKMWKVYRLMDRQQMNRKTQLIFQLRLVTKGYMSLVYVNECSYTLHACNSTIGCRKWYPILLHWSFSSGLICQKSSNRSNTCGISSATIPFGWGKPPV